MWAVLPVKQLYAAKSRLREVLTREQRACLVCAMAGDVLDILLAEPRIEQVCVVSDDQRVGALASARGAVWWTEQELGAGEGLNAVVTAAAARLARHACDEMLVAHADLPLLDNATLSRFIDAWRALPIPRGLALAPSHDRGTNLLLCDPRTPFEFCYGPGSLHWHAAQARFRGCMTAVMELERAALDIDTPDDLGRLLRNPRRRPEAGTSRALAFLPADLQQRLLAASPQPKASCHEC